MQMSNYYLSRSSASSAFPLVGGIVCAALIFVMFGVAM